MICPVCERPTGVVDSRSADNGAAVWRRRECRRGHRFETIERDLSPAEKKEVKRAWQKSLDT